MHTAGACVLNSLWLGGHGQSSADNRGVDPWFDKGGVP